MEKLRKRLSDLRSNNGEKRPKEREALNRLYLKAAEEGFNNNIDDVLMHPFNSTSSSSFCVSPMCHSPTSSTSQSSITSNTMGSSSPTISVTSAITDTPTDVGHSFLSLSDPTSSSTHQRSPPTTKRRSNIIADNGPSFTYYKGDHILNHPLRPFNVENVTFCFKCDPEEGNNVREARNEFVVPTGFQKRDGLDILFYRRIFVCDSCALLVEESLIKDEYAIINISTEARSLYKPFKLSEKDKKT